MNLIFIWFVAYVIPALIVGGLLKLLPRKVGFEKRNTIITHSGLLVSILATQYTVHILGLSFPWNPDIFSISTLGLSILFALYMLGWFGIWYGLSAFLQQMTVLSISFLLLPSFPIFLVILLVVPIFLFAHLLSVKHWQIKIVSISLWGMISILLFSVWPNIYLITALHTLFGVILISQSILYPEMQFKKSGDN